MHPFAAYFARPFPKAEGFSPYRMPGLLVHLPVLGIFALLGLTLSAPLTLWLALLWVAAGLYVGRDVAILAHYAPIITLAVLALIASALVAPQFVGKLLHAFGSLGPAAAVAATAGLVVAWALWIGWYTRDRR